MLLLIGFAHACNAGSTGDKDDIGKLFGRYEIIGYQQYGGGLTTEESARKRVGEVILIERDRFAVQGKSIKSPIYRIERVKVDHGEGNIIPRDLSVFYGYKDDRRTVVRLLVYDSKDALKSDDWRYRFEMLEDGTLLEMYDGRFYFMKKKP